jgi:FkbM family methyltransferase
MKKSIKKLILKNAYLSRLVFYFLNYKWLFDILSFFNIPFVVKIIDNEKIKLFPKGQIAEIIFQKKFENNELLTFQKLLKKGMTVIDAGANIGLYTLIASKIVGENGKVFSFEPSKETYERLKNNVTLNQSTNIEIINCGLGDTPDQMLQLRQDLGYDDAERYLVPLNHNINNELENVGELNLSEKVKIDTLDNFCKKNNIKQINLLKIDTEGFEYYILNGSRNILKNSEKLIILMECTAMGTKRANTTQEKVFDILIEEGFKIFYWNTNINNWSTDTEGCLMAGDLWVCKNVEQLNFYK